MSSQLKMRPMRTSRRSSSVAGRIRCSWKRAATPSSMPLSTVGIVCHLSPFFHDSDVAMTVWRHARSCRSRRASRSPMSKDTTLSPKPTSTTRGSMYGNSRLAYFISRYLLWMPAKRLEVSEEVTSSSEMPAGRIGASLFGADSMNIPSHLPTASLTHSMSPSSNPRSKRIFNRLRAISSRSTSPSMRARAALMLPHGADISGSGASHNPPAHAGYVS